MESALFPKSASLQPLPYPCSRRIRGGETEKSPASGHPSPAAVRTASCRRLHAAQALSSKSPCTFPKKPCRFPGKPLPLFYQTPCPSSPRRQGIRFSPPRQTGIRPGETGEKVGSRLCLVKHCYTSGGRGKFFYFCCKSS